MYNKFDLHIHTKYSACAVNEPKTIVKKCLEKGISGFAITDHNKITAWPELHKLAKENNLVFIPGQEISATYKGKRIGHLLALFTLDKIISTEIYEVIDEIKNQSALLSVAHPFDMSRGLLVDWLDFDNKHNIFKKIYAMETFNSRVLSSKNNDKANDFAEEHNLIKTGGSDAHMPYEVGNGFVIADANSETELFKQIKLRKVAVGGQLSGLKTRFHTLGSYLSVIKDSSFN